MQRLENPKTNVMYCSAPTYIYICNTLPLDNLKIHLHLALSYITIYKSRGQSRSYSQGGYQARSDNRNKGYIVNNSSRQNYIGNIFRGNFTGYGRQINRENYRNEGYGNNNRDRNRLRERTFTRSYGASTNRDRIRCYACREYDHFARDCPNSPYVKYGRAR